MVCSCVIPSKCVLLQIIFCVCVISTRLSGEKLADRFRELPEVDLNMKTKLAIEWQNNIVGHLQITFSLFLKASLDAHPLIWKWDFIHMQSKLIFIWMVVNQASFWWRGWTWLSQIMIHQMFLLSHNCSKCFTWLNIPQLKLGKLRVIFPNFQNCAFAENIWRIINTTASIWLRQIIDLLATDKSQYFAQPRPTIVHYVATETDENLSGLTEYGNEELHSAKNSQFSYVALFVF